MLVGVTWMDTSVAEVTISVVLPVTEPMVAAIDAVPAATDAARPLEPAALLIVITPASEVDHVAVDVTSAVEPPG